jgi:hypothetical protein
MGDIQTPTTKWKKRNSTQRMKSTMQIDSSGTMTDNDKTESFTTDIFKSADVGLNQNTDTPPLRFNTNSSKSIDMTSPFNMTSAPLQTVFDNVLFRNDDFEKVVEGFTCDTSAIKSVKDKVKIVTDFLEIWFIKILEFVLIKGPTLMVNKITDGICGKGDEASPKEKDLVKSHVKEFFATLLACYITYNWYYVMFYPRKRLPRPLLNITTDHLSDKNKWVSLACKYLIVPLSLMNSILLKKLPFVLYPLDRRSKFLFLFYFIPKIILKNGAEIARAFVDSVRLKKTKHNGMFIAIMVVFGVTSLLRFRLKLRYFLELYRFFLQISLFSIPILILFVMRILFSTSHIWFTGILVFGYLLVISFFAMNVYGKTGNTYSIIYEINKHIYYKKPKKIPKPCDLDYYDESGCTPKPFSVRLQEFYTYMCEKLFKYKYEVTFIIFFMNSFYSYIYKLKGGTRIKQNLVVLTFFGIFLCLTIVGYREFVRKEDYDKANEEKLKAERKEAMIMFGEVPEYMNENADPPEDDSKKNKPQLSVFERLYKATANEEVVDSEDEDDENDVLNKSAISAMFTYLSGNKKDETTKDGSNKAVPTSKSGDETAKDGSNKAVPTSKSGDETVYSEISQLFSGLNPRKNKNDEKTNNVVVNSDQTIVKSYVPVEQIVYTTDPALSSQSALTKPFMPTQEPAITQTSTPILTPPIQGNAVPIQGNAVPIQGNVLPIQGNAVPIQGNAVPIQGNVLPIQGNAVPIQGNAVPIQGNAVPIQGNAVPIQGNAKPIQGNSNPINKTPVSTKRSSIFPSFYKRK